jgi:hypothetical protein
VAVVQISKIQIRRGLKNSSSGVPQLSSAELAWAVDSQELYIGNGSVAEGAPYVGNTKVLTEHDNILELASSYEFAFSDPSINAVSRSLQSKSDEYVSVADFGAVNDGSTDCVAAFELAFTELFRNVDTTYRKVLKVPNGTYLFLTDLAIPSNIILEGETRDGAILNFDTSNIRLITESGSDLNEFDSSNRPENISISNLTIARSSGQTVLTGGAHIKFTNVLFKGEYNLGNTVNNLTTEPAAVFWENAVAGIKVTDLTFDKCEFENNSVSVKCTQSITTQTFVNFQDTKFFVNDTSIYINGISQQGNNWVVSHCEFEEIAGQAFRSTAGYNTRIENCRFLNCGNNTNTAANPVTSIVYFGEEDNNIVINCSSDRQQASGITSSELTPAIPEVYNASAVSFVDRNTSEIFLSDSFRPLAVFSTENKHIYIDYILKLSVHRRAGRIKLVIDDDNENVSLIDEYNFSSQSPTHPGGSLMTNFEFSVEMKNNSTFGDSSLATETVVLYYKNPLQATGRAGSSGTISFNVSYGV